MRKVIVCIAVLALTSTGAFAAISLPLTDEFNSGGPDHSWSYYGGVYSAAASNTKILNYQGQDCLQVDDGSGWQFVFPTDDDGTLANVTVEAYQYLGSDSTGWARVGVGVRVAGTGWANARDSGYWVYSDTDADNYFSVGTCMQNWGGLPHARLYGPAVCTRNVWRRWAIEIDGNNLTAYSDTEGAYGVVYGPIDITTLDASQQWTSGYVGIGNFLYSGAVGYSYTDRIYIEDPSSVDNWTLY